MARRTSSLVRLSASPTAGRRARETSVLTAERLARFRLRLRNEARTRFFADWVFAMRAVVITPPPRPSPSGGDRCEPRPYARGGGRKGEWHAMSGERRRIAAAASRILTA